MSDNEDTVSLLETPDAITTEEDAKPDKPAKLSPEEEEYERKMMEEALKLSMMEAGKDAPNPTTNQIPLNQPYSWHEVFNIIDQSRFVIIEHYDQEVIGSGTPEWKMTKEGVRYIQVTVTLVAAYGAGSYTYTSEVVNVPFYPGKKNFMDLPVRPYQESTDYFVERGQKFEALTKKPSYRYAKGKIYVPNPMSQEGFNRIPVDGRVMVDPFGYQKHASADRWHQRQEMEDIPEGMHQSTLSTVPIFSFEHRMWGEVPVDQIEEIDFDKTAFDRTVIPQRYKDMISRLVQNFYKTECVNFVKGKGRGLIFSLHGPPGVGKTLTATGVSELLGLPLYCVGTGDLGTNPQMIEKKLTQIFQMVEHWNGVVQIDEADTLMAKRSDFDINKNACVSVFLRLIESYSGIMFLTTNRDHDIDEAFKSRIHIPLRYTRLDEDGRSQVWTETLHRHGVDGLDVTPLAAIDMNNREIANCVMTAYLQAGGDPNQVTVDLLMGYVELRKDYQTGEVE